jgi:hypothetical protein
MKIRICIALVAVLIMAKPVAKTLRRTLEQAAAARDVERGQAALLELDVLRILGLSSRRDHLCDPGHGQEGQIA